MIQLFLTEKEIKLIRRLLQQECDFRERAHDETGCQEASNLEDEMARQLRRAKGDLT